MIFCRDHAAGRFRPGRLISHDFETVVESATSGEPIAFLPNALFSITTYPSSHKWTATNGHHVAFLELAVAAVSAEDRPS